MSSRIASLVAVAAEDPEPLAVLADPEGNEFRLCRDRVDALPGQSTHTDAR